VGGQQDKDGCQWKGKEESMGKRKSDASDGGEQGKEKRKEKTKDMAGSQDKGEGGGGMLTYANVC